MAQLQIARLAQQPDIPPPLRTDQLFYLATPYSLYPAGLEAAFIEAVRLAAALVREKSLRVFSPIAYGHLLAVHGAIDPRNQAFWCDFDELMIGKSDALIVAHMGGWEQSRGIGHEIAMFRAARKSIFDLVNLNGLQLEKRV